MKQPQEIIIKDDDSQKTEASRPIQFLLLHKMEGWIKKYPKQSYYLLLGIMLLTLCSAVWNLMAPQQEKIKAVRTSHPEKVHVPETSVTGAALDFYQAQEDRKELEYYKQKGLKNLSPEELEKARYLIEKYGLTQKQEK